MSRKGKLIFNDQNFKGFFLDDLFVSLKGKESLNPTFSQIFWLKKEAETSNIPVCYFFDKKSHLHGAPCFPDNNTAIASLYTKLDFRSASSTETSITKTSNLSIEIIEEFKKQTGLLFIPQQEVGNLCFATNNHELQDDFKQVFTPEDVWAYAWAFSVSSTRKRYQKEITARQIPILLPIDTGMFWQIVGLGKELENCFRQKKTLISTQLLGQGTNNVDLWNFVSDSTKEGIGTLWINSSQYFSSIPEELWNLRVGMKSPLALFLKSHDHQKLSEEAIEGFNMQLGLWQAVVAIQKRIDVVLRAYYFRR